MLRAVRFHGMGPEQSRFWTPSECMFAALVGSEIRSSKEAFGRFGALRLDRPLTLSRVGFCRVPKCKHTSVGTTQPWIRAVLHPRTTSRVKFSDWLARSRDWLGGVRQSLNLEGLGLTAYAIGRDQTNLSESRRLLTSQSCDLPIMSGNFPGLRDPVVAKRCPDWGPQGRVSGGTYVSPGEADGYLSLEVRSRL